MNELCTAKQPTLPIFKEIVEAFEGVSNALKENSNVIYGKVNSIREKCEPSDEKTKHTPPATVVDELWSCVFELRDINYTLSKTRENLHELVG